MGKINIVPVKLGGRYCNAEYITVQTSTSSYSWELLGTIGAESLGTLATKNGVSVSLSKETGTDFVEEVNFNDVHDHSGVDVIKSVTTANKNLPTVAAEQISGSDYRIKVTTEQVKVVSSTATQKVVTTTNASGNYIFHDNTPGSVTKKKYTPTVNYS